MTLKRFFIFFTAALFAHILAVVVTLQVIILSTILTPPTPRRLAPVDEPMTVTITPPPPQRANTQPTRRSFIDTTNLTPSDKSDPEALFEGAANTKVASKTAGNGDPRMANQDGMNRDDIEMRDSPNSVGLTGMPSPIPAKEPEKPKPPQPTDKPSQDTAAQKKPTPTDAPTLRPGNMFSQAPKEQETKPKEDAKTADKNADNPATAARPPPSTMAFARTRTAEKGGASVGDDSSVSTQETELGRYKLKLYRAVGSRWYLYVQNQLSTLSVGKVRVRFYVRANGVIEKPEFIEGNDQTALAAISKKSVMDVGALEPFSDQLKQQLGDGYWEEISFSVY